jgi:hypothetical protein
LQPIAKDGKRPEVIPVRKLLFPKDSPMDAPHVGLNMSAHCSVSENGHATRYKIDYYPALRHHRIEYTAHGGEQKVGWVHETRALCWVPLEL